MEDVLWITVLSQELGDFLDASFMSQTSPRNMTICSRFEIVCFQNRFSSSDHQWKYGTKVIKGRVCGIHTFHSY